jgi:hypothetical protein
MDTELQVVLDIDRARALCKDQKIRIKCLALHNMNKSILTNIFQFSYEERTKLNEEYMKIFKTMSEEDIIDSFNKICTSEIFSRLEWFERLPVYS